MLEIGHKNNLEFVSNFFFPRHFNVMTELYYVTTSNSSKHSVSNGHELTTSEEFNDLEGQWETICIYNNR